VPKNASIGENLQDHSSTDTDHVQSQELLPFNSFSFEEGRGALECISQEGREIKRKLYEEG